MVDSALGFGEVDIVMDITGVGWLSCVDEVIGVDRKRKWEERDILQAQNEPGSSVNVCVVLFPTELGRKEMETI